MIRLLFFFRNSVSCQTYYTLLLWNLHGPMKAGVWDHLDPKQATTNSWSRHQLQRESMTAWWKLYFKAKHQVWRSKIDPKGTWLQVWLIKIDILKIMYIHYIIKLLHMIQAKEAKLMLYLLHLYSSMLCLQKKKKTAMNFS